MSTKCTVICDDHKQKDIWYHFYFDYADDNYHLDVLNKKSEDAFFRRIGKILEGCPFSDAGIYQISMKPNVKTKVFKNKDCWLLKKQSEKKLIKRQPKRKIARWKW